MTRSWRSIFLLTLTSSITGGLSNVLSIRQAASTTGTGDSICTSAMCIGATLNGSTVNYVLSPSSKGQTPGWMAIGFGQSMAGSPMVIMWGNKDNSITLSQRQANGLTAPKVVSNPPRVASLSMSASTTSGNDVKYAFSIPHDGKTSQTLVWAVGTNPGSSDTQASIRQHSAKGSVKLDLSRSLASGGNHTSSGIGSSSDNGSSSDIPLLPYQRIIIAHGIFCVAGFLFFLPAGALLARYMRTFSNAWFRGHWITQMPLGGLSIIIGVALGVQSVSSAKAMHLDDAHKQWGIVIFVIYIVQCLIGTLIHYVKPAKPSGRPLQNYFHAVLGLFIIAIGLYQVRTGYKYEWPAATGREDLGIGVDIVWYVWVVLLPVIYAAGLSFIRKQYRQESENRNKLGDLKMPLDRDYQK